MFAKIEHGQFSVSNLGEPEILLNNAYAEAEPSQRVTERAQTGL